MRICFVGKALLICVFCILLLAESRLGVVPGINGSGEVSAHKSKECGAAVAVLHALMAKKQRSEVGKRAEDEGWQCGKDRIPCNSRRSKILYFIPLRQRRTQWRISYKFFYPPHTTVGGGIHG